MQSRSLDIIAELGNMRIDALHRRYAKCVDRPPIKRLLNRGLLIVGILKHEFHCSELAGPDAYERGKEEEDE